MIENENLQLLHMRGILLFLYNPLGHSRIKVPIYQGIPPKKMPRKNLAKATKNSYGKSVRNSLTGPLKLVTERWNKIRLATNIYYLTCIIMF